MTSHNYVLMNMHILISISIKKKRIQTATTWQVKGSKIHGDCRRSNRAGCSKRRAGISYQNNNFTVQWYSWNSPHGVSVNRTEAMNDSHCIGSWHAYQLCIHNIQTLYTSLRRKKGKRKRKRRGTSSFHTHIVAMILLIVDTPQVHMKL